MHKHKTEIWLEYLDLRDLLGSDALEYDLNKSDKSSDKKRKEAKST